MLILAGVGLLLLGAFSPEDGDPMACTRRVAVRTSVAVVRADPAAWEGRCVTMTGIVRGRRLYRDRAALAESEQGTWQEDDRRSILLYRGRTLSARRPIAMEVTGKLDSCLREHEAVAALARSEPDSFVMVGGFCHTSLEPYLSPTAFRPRSRGQGRR
jgi:hypothetical protein